MDTQPASAKQEVHPRGSATERKEATDAQAPPALPPSPAGVEPSPSRSKMPSPSAAVFQAAPQLQPSSSTVESEPSSSTTESQPCSSKVELQPSSSTTESQPRSSKTESQPSSSKMESQPSSSTVESQPSSSKVESQPSSSTTASQPPASKALRSSPPRPESASEPASLAERLPDELLLLILAGLRDAATLLDSVPLVCRRWRRLARDPRAWAGASLSLTYGIADRYRGYKDEEQLVLGEVHLRTKDARFLLHAPASAVLHLDLKFSSSALVVDFWEEFYFNKEEKAKRQCVPLTEVLGRCPARIAGLSSQELTDHQVDDERKRERRSSSTYKPFKAVLQVMAAHEEHLQHLILKLLDGSYGLADECCTAMLSALASAELLEAVRRCSALRSLRCPLECVSALSAMPGLRELQLDFWNYRMSRPVGDWPAPGSLPALRSLVIPSFCALADSSSVSASGWLGELLEDLARAASGITQLTIADLKERCAEWDDDGTLATVLGLLPGLRSLVVDGGPEVLSLLLEEPLEALAELRAVIVCELVDFVETQSDVDKLEARRPGVDVTLDLMIKGPEGMRFSWGKPL